MNTILANNVCDAYVLAITKMRRWGIEEDSRNGPVITSEEPVYLQIERPRERVLFDEVRCCNPFFHVMEVVWMFAGENNVKWIEQFNRKFRSFADDSTDTIHGAYGHRWLRHFDVDQITTVADSLHRDPYTRRAVIAMWDPSVDLQPHNDLPCNTQIMFRTVNGALDMTVINRSNDLIWGMLGANVVHMTYLHELISFMSGIPMGMYKVFTNNLHIYKDMPNFEAIWATETTDDQYLRNELQPYPLMWPGETFPMLRSDCELLICDGRPEYLLTNWAKAIAWPMKMAYQNRLSGGDGISYVPQINSLDWRAACVRYINQKDSKKQ